MIKISKVEQQEAYSVSALFWENLRRAFSAANRNIQEDITLIEIKARRNPRLDILSELSELDWAGRYSSVIQLAWESSVLSAAEMVASAELIRNRAKTTSTARVATAAIRGHIATTSARRITGIQTTTKDAISAIIMNHHNRGATIDKTARRIRLIIGQPRKSAIASLRMIVQSEARDESGKLITNLREIEKFVERRTKRALAIRAMTIARTETIAAANVGREAAWVAMRSEGMLPADAMKKWEARFDIACKICRELHEHEPILLGSSFSSSFVGFVARPPSHQNCRCGVLLVNV